jgi:hypothetical protein
VQINSGLRTDSAFVFAIKRLSTDETGEIGEKHGGLPYFQWFSGSTMRSMTVTAQPSLQAGKTLVIEMAMLFRRKVGGLI